MKIEDMRGIRRGLIATCFVLLLPHSWVFAQQQSNSIQDATARLQVYTTKHFVLKSDSPRQYAKDLGTKLDIYYEQLGEMLPKILGEPLQPIRASVILFEKQDDYQQYANRNAPQLINNGGFYDGATRTIVTYRYNNSLQLYFHEILHAVMGELFKDHYFLRYSKKNWPIWFDEGLAEYFGSFELRDGTLRFGARNKTKIAYLLNALHTKSFVSLPKMLTALSDRYSGATMNLYYAEAWGLMDFLVHHERYRKALPRFFAAIKAGRDGYEAFQEHFSSDLTDLNKRWEAHLWSLGAISEGWQDLFDGQSIDGWTIHEGGQWSIQRGQIDGRGNENYNYLIRSELPRTSFTFSLDIRLEEGTAGVILGNNYHDEYPYYYLIDIAHNQVTLRRAFSATKITTVRDEHPHIPSKNWLPVSVSVANDRLRVWVNGQLVIDEPEHKDRYSLFGVYLYQGRARFRNLRIRNEPPIPPAAPATLER